VSQCRDSSQDSSLKVEVADTELRQVTGTEKRDPSLVYGAHSDDVGISPNRDFSTESDEILSVCERKPELCVADGSCELQSHVEIRTHQIINSSGKSDACDKYQTGLATHTGEKPYQCSVCDKRLSVEKSVKLHMRTHTGEKLYKCDVCDVGFSAKDKLKRHVRTHTRESPFKCEVCG
jgi:uncharacterized Zn-finger protein